jgi:ATP-dependent DNA helicase RecG
MDLAALLTRVSQGEDSRQQFKEDIHSADSLSAELVAFSNSEGGTLFIGVSNTGQLKGLLPKDVDRINQMISNSASQHVRSPISVQTQNIQASDGRIVIVVSVPKGIDKPYFDAHGVIWLKNGADKRRVNSKEELRRLFQEVDLLHADEIPVKAGLEALDLPLFNRFFRATYQEAPPRAKQGLEHLLVNMNLAEGKCLNLAGLLLFGQRPQFFKPECMIKAATFPGHEIGSRYLDSEDFEGPLPEVFRAALAYIMRNLKKIQGSKSVNSIGDPEIPRLVFEELLVNALIHRDYFITAPIRLFIFDDRIEIISPGHLPNHLTIEKIRAGNSIQRNPVLASFVSKGLLPYRGLGTGIRRAMEEWPKIRFIDDRENLLFTSIIDRVHQPSYMTLKEVADPINDLINDPIKDLDHQILALVTESPTLSYDAIALQLSKSESTVKRHIQALKSKGVLVRQGSKKSGRWSLKNSGAGL